jgi:hypothetical protein
MWSYLHSETDPSIDARMKGHNQHNCLDHLDKAALAVHGVNFRHCTELHKTYLLQSDPDKYMKCKCIIREVTEIELHSNNVNREDGLCLSKSWKSLMYSL